MHGYHWVEDRAWREHLCGDMSSGLVVSSMPDHIVSVTNWFGNVCNIGACGFAGNPMDEEHRIEVWSQGMTRTPLDNFCYPFGDQSDPADWLEVAPMGNLRLILYHEAEDWEGVTGYGLTQIACQQAHPY